MQASSPPNKTFRTSCLLNQKRQMGGPRKLGRSERISILHNAVMDRGSVPEPVVDTTKMTRSSDTSSDCYVCEQPLLFILRFPGTRSWDVQDEHELIFASPRTLRKRSTLGHFYFISNQNAKRNKMELRKGGRTTTISAKARLAS